MWQPFNIAYVVVTLTVKLLRSYNFVVRHCNMFGNMFGILERGLAKELGPTG